MRKLQYQQGIIHSLTSLIHSNVHEFTFARLLIKATSDEIVLGASVLVLIDFQLSVIQINIFLN